MSSHFVSIKFKNYKAFKNYSVTLAEFNILVGANNAGKSTVIGAFRILAEGLRRAQSRNPEYNDSPLIRGFCYPVNLKDLPVSTENIFTNYDDSQPASIEFKISNGNRLVLLFPEQDSCYLICEKEGKPVRSTTDFKQSYDVVVSFVPVLGPVEHDEELNVRETARRALSTHRASRNFRNIWYHFPDDFDKFQGLIRETWPGMEIQEPELVRDQDSAKLYMFCPEERVPRELFWAGFGFQVWCQMLTFIAKSPLGSMLIIDEPDIYLHSDLQRQLVHLLRSRQGDVLVATHSTEILAEAEAGEIVVLNKKGHSAQRVQNPTELQNLFGVLGSSLNPILTQLAKTKKVVFVEGDDFSLLSAFSRKIGFHSIANRSAFAVIPAKGFNPSRVVDFSEGMQATLGVTIKRAVIFDRDYRSQPVVDGLRAELSKNCEFVWIHERKELENFLLVPSALERAIRNRLDDRRARGVVVKEFEADLLSILDEVTRAMKSEVFGQCNASGVSALREMNRGMDQATASAIVHREMEGKWDDMAERLKIVPGKMVLAKLNESIQASHGVSITINSIVQAMKVSEIPTEMAELIRGLEHFGKT